VVSVVVSVPVDAGVGYPSVSTAPPATLPTVIAILALVGHGFFSLFDS